VFAPETWPFWRGAPPENRLPVSFSGTFTILPLLEYVLPLFAVLIVSLSFHEAAHAWTADRLGDPTARMLGRITLNPLAHIDWIGTVLFPLIAIYSGIPLLGWAKPVPVNMHNLRHPRRDFALVALAGPVSNLVIALVIAILRPFVAQATGVMSGPSRWLAHGLELNVLLAVFNMIPVPPLDGGNVLAGLVPEQAARIIDALRAYGFIIIYAMLLTGVLWAIVGPISAGILTWLN
jgi:Zn-dependent protease